MSRLYATAGSKLYIGPAKAFNGTNFVASDFNSIAWTEIGGTTNLGAAGDTAQLITSDQINSARTRKLKGTKNAGSMAVVCDLDSADPGQIALIAAEASKDSFPFRLVFNDAPIGGTPSERLFVAFVMSSSEELNEANNVMKLNATLEIDSNIVPVPAAASGSAPDNTVLPAITGTATEGQTLTASSGTWTGSPTPTYAYQWFGTGESLAGETGDTLELTEDHVGMNIAVQVTATNVNGSKSAISTATSAVASA